MSNIIKTLEILKIDLPPAAKPVANYSPFVVTENKVYISGQIPFKNETLLYQGKAGKDITLEESKSAAELCFINTLSVLNLATKYNLNKVDSCIKITVFINSTNDFIDQSLVADGASNLIKKIFKHNGNHARSAVSCNSLPKNASVEIDSIFSLIR